MSVPSRVMRRRLPFTHLGIIILEESTSVWTHRMCLSRDETRGSWCGWWELGRRVGGQWEGRGQGLMLDGSVSGPSV